MKHIIDYTQSPADHEVGGKFSQQAQLIDAGLPVPKFVCLSRAFYESVVESKINQIGALLGKIHFDDHKSITHGSDSLKALIEGVILTEQQESQILEAFEQHFQDEVLVSIRASTVGYIQEESEDSVSNPFAGMSESFLYVPKDQVIEKVKQCWASGFSQESLIYRHSQGMNLMGFGVAVGIQEMVFGTKSFVMFTADPKTAARDTIIISGYGIGEGVVQERVAVDHYFINGKTQAITSKTDTKSSQLVFDSEIGYGLKEADVDPEKQNPPCLEEAELRQLVDLGAKVEQLFSLPQDIEGTITEDGKIYLLQSRPIALDFDRQLVWTNTNVTESYPGVSSTLTYTHAKYFYRVIFRDLYRRLGVSNETIWSNFQPLDSMIGYLKGHIYYCLSHFYLLHKQNPLYPLFGSHWENMIGLRSSFQTHETSKFKQIINKVRTGLGIGKALINILADYFNHDKSMYRYHRWWEQRIASMRGKSFVGEDPLKLVNLFYDVWTEVGREWGVTLTTDAYLIPMYGWAEILFKKWDLEKDDPGLLSDLLCGDEKLLSVEIILSAVSLAEQVRSDSNLRQHFENKDEKSLWNSLAAGEMEDSFTENVKRHLHLYGDRGLQELKVEQPSLRDTPWVLMRMIRQYALQEVTVQSFREHEDQVRIKADRRLHELLQGHPYRLKLLQKVLLPRLRRLIRHRENSRYCRSELFGFSKQIFNGLAHYFVSRGVLEKHSDIYHLTQEEVFGYVNGMGVTENLQAVADLRRSEYEVYLQTETAEQITTLGAVPDNELIEVNTSEYGEDSLIGLGSSAGRVQGRAKVVTDPNSVDDIGNDMILIARETDPGWLFLMLASKGMVVERGSMLSHTAITGRKFGIPTIVALSNATRIIPDGALIEIDGSSGVVTILDDGDNDKADEVAA